MNGDATRGSKPASILIVDDTPANLQVLARMLEDRGYGANYHTHKHAKVQRWLANPLKVVARQDERNDRRRVRRPLTNDEVAKLLAVAGPRGRHAWYMAAALAGHTLLSCG